MEKTKLVKSGFRLRRYVNPATYGEKKIENPAFFAGAAQGISIAELVLGVLALVFGLAGTIIVSPAGLTGSGIWAGVSLLITGVIGVIASIKKGEALIVSYMILNILNAVICTGAMVVTFYFVYDGAVQQSLYSDRELAMDVLVVILSFIGLAMSIAASGFGCATVCCPPSGPKERQLITVNAQHIHGERTGNTVSVVQDEESATQYSETEVTDEGAKSPAENLQDSLLRELDPGTPAKRVILVRSGQ